MFKQAQELLSVLKNFDQRVDLKLEQGFKAKIIEPKIDMVQINSVVQGQIEKLGSKLEE